jgi:hypothetical protein
VNRTDLDARTLNITLDKLEMLRSACQTQYRYDRFINLVVSSWSSPFRISMQQQAREWLDSPSPKYPSPFSPEQWKCI